MYNVILFGPPGSGKGTQSARIIEKYKLTHLSTGDLLRKEIKSGSELGKEIAELINHGNLVSDEMAQKMVMSFLDLHKEENGFVFDGFPRTAEQAIWLRGFLQSKGSEINALIALKVDDEELANRLLERGKDSGRADDQTMSTVRTRIKLYHDLTEPVINFYIKLNKYYQIDGLGSLDEVFERICNVIDK